MAVRSQTFRALMLAGIAGVAGVLACGPRALASVLLVPGNLAEEVLSESVPTALPAADFTIQDFALEWEGEPIAGVEFFLGKASLQWVRASEVLSIPRARAIVSVKEASSGIVSNAGFSQPLAIKPGTSASPGSRGRAELPVALIDSAENRIHIRISRDGRTWEGLARIRFRPRPEIAATDRVYFDASCSRFGVRLDPVPQGGAATDKAADWAYVGCRSAIVEGSSYRTASLEMLVFWSGVGAVKINGIAAAAASPALWALRLRSEPGQLTLQGGDRTLNLRYSLADRLRLGSLGLGIGPYQYTFQSANEDTRGTPFLLTLYGSYFITESMRLVAFDATVLNSKFDTDFGVYLNTEYARLLDRRIALYLMLGGHSVGFKSGSDYFFKFGLPQGLEVIVSDVLKRGYNLSLGGFLYPKIGGRSYYNLWLRWGGRIFGELNYISWRELIQERDYYSRSVGFSLGFPIGRFW